MAFHFILQRLDSPGSYDRILSVDFSSAFNTIVPALLRDKLSQLNVPDSMYSWITDFLTDRRQLVRLGKHVTDSRNISTGSPQGCVLSPLLFSLYTNGCISGHQSVKILKFADDTTLNGFISDEDESAYRSDMDCLVSWCSMNNLELNSLKTVEITVDFRKDPVPLPHVILCDSSVTSVESFRFLGTTITGSTSGNISSLTKKAQQRMYLRCCYSLHSAEKVIGCSFPSLQELYISRTRDVQPRLQPTPLILEMNSFSPYPLARGSSPSGPGPHATRTVSSPL
ncbi:hypothetical protein QTP70_034823, partial [Hemibagrus guttatus]